MQPIKLSIRDLCQISVFTAITCVCAQISIPMPYGVAMTLQTFAIPLAGMILGPKKGTFSTLVYILIGAVGIPVFSGFKGGIGIIAGATGGFILSFPLMSLMAGIAAIRKTKFGLILCLVFGTLLNYLCGVLYFTFVMMSDMQTAFIACILPFIPTDIVKITLCAVLGVKLKKVLIKSNIMA